MSRYVSYSAGEKPAHDWESYALLSSNENPLGASPLALRAIHERQHLIQRYPDSRYSELRQAIAQTHDLDPDCVVVGCGSDELIGHLIHTTARSEHGSTAHLLTVRPGFSMYRIIAQNYGMAFTEVPLQDFEVNVHKLAECCTEHTSLCILANPNNPTGTFTRAAELQRLRSLLPERVLLAVDEAYGEYVDTEHSNELMLASALSELPNTAVLRTFSKFYGLAGLRVGWGMFPKALAQALNKLRHPFSVNILAASAAIAALSDHEHQQKCYEHNQYWRRWLANALHALGLKCIRSDANFLLVHCGSAQRASAFYQGLKQHRILVRLLSDYDLSEFLRISVGNEQENRALVDCLKTLQVR